MPLKTGRSGVLLERGAAVRRDLALADPPHVSGSAIPQIAASFVVKSLISASSTADDDALAHRGGLAGDLRLGVDLAAAVVELERDVGVRVALSRRCPCDLTRSTRAMRRLVLSTTSTVPANVIDIAPILTLISAFARSGSALDDLAALDARDDPVEVQDRVPVVVGGLPVENEWSSSTMFYLRPWSRSGFASIATSTTSATFKVPNSAE